MDKIPQLITDWKIWGVLLAIIAITDIPKSFFTQLIKWFFERKSKDYWPSKPNRPSYLFPVIGLLKYRRTKQDRNVFANQLLTSKKNTISQLFKKILKKNLIETYESFESRNEIHLSKDLINVIEGIPGSGKSSFIINYLESLLQQSKIDYIFYFDYYTLKTKYNILNKSQESTINNDVWNSLGLYIIDNPLPEVGAISPTLASFLLNYKSVYFVIDGIDNENELNIIITNLKRHISKYHSKNKKLKIIVSTRTYSNFSELGTNKIYFIPLLLDEVRGYFFKISHRLDMNLLGNPNFISEVDSQKSILNFNNKLTQTPLFAEIINIVIYKQGLEKITDKLYQSVAGIYKLFIQTLFETSNQGQTNYNEFYIPYRKLAMETWSSGNFIDIQVIKKVFNNTKFDEVFMVQNGLLIQDSSYESNYSFIHKAIQDVLAIESIVLSKDFSFFQTKMKIGEDIIYYLEEEISNIIEYCSLLKINIVLAESILSRALFQKISSGGLDASIRLILSSFIDSLLENDEIGEEDFEPFLRLFRKLSDWRNGTSSFFIEEVKYKSHSLRLLKAILFLNIKETKDYIKSLISKNECTAILGSLLIENSSLQKLVNEEFENEKLSPIIISDVILFAVRADIKNKQNSYKLRLINKMGILSDDTIKSLLSNEEIRTQVIYTEYENKIIKTTQRINNILIQILKEILIPKGKFNIDNVIVKNNHTITLNMQIPNCLLVEGSNMSVAIRNMENNVRNDLWTFEQFQIGYSLFEGTLQNKFNGFYGLHSSPNVMYEAVRENNNGNISLAYFSLQNTKSNIVISKESNQQNFKQEVFWRSIQKY